VHTSNSTLRGDNIDIQVEGVVEVGFIFIVLVQIKIHSLPFTDYLSNETDFFFPFSLCASVPTVTLVFSTPSIVIFTR